MQGKDRLLKVSGTWGSKAWKKGWGPARWAGRQAGSGRAHAPKTPVMKPHKFPLPFWLPKQKWASSLSQVWKKTVCFRTFCFEWGRKGGHKRKSISFEINTSTSVFFVCFFFLLMKIFASHIHFRQSVYSTTRWPGFEHQLWSLLALISEQSDNLSWSYFLHLDACKE